MKKRQTKKLHVRKIKRHSHCHRHRCRQKGGISEEAQKICQKIKNNENGSGNGSGNGTGSGNENQTIIEKVGNEINNALNEVKNDAVVLADNVNNLILSSDVNQEEEKQEDQICDAVCKEKLDEFETLKIELDECNKENNFNRANLISGVTYKSAYTITKKINEENQVINEI